jgi:hypothetical protein
MTKKSSPGVIDELQGHHTDQTCHKPGIIPPEYLKEVFHCTKGRNVWCTESPLYIPDQSAISLKPKPLASRGE